MAFTQLTHNSLFTDAQKYFIIFNDILFFEKFLRTCKNEVTRGMIAFLHIEAMCDAYLEAAYNSDALHEELL